VKNILKKPDYVIFDMDGTTVRHVNPAMLSVLEFLDNVIYKIARLFSRKKEITDFSENPATPRGLLVHKALHKLRRKEVGQIVQPCPGIFLLLNLLRRHNIPMAIASNGLGKGYGHEILETFNLANYFDVELFREDVQKSKPHPDGILRGLRLLREQSGRRGDGSLVVWHIGDRHKDIMATIEANKISEDQIIPFSYGIHAAVAILKNNIGTENIIVSYPDFFDRIKPLFEGEEESAKN
jgi:phosphoglycolate phosphatase